MLYSYVLCSLCCPHLFNTFQCVVLYTIYSTQHGPDVLTLQPSFAAAPLPPTGVSVVDGSECYTSVVMWGPPPSKCNVVIGNYSVRYQQRNSSGSNTTVYTDGTSVTLVNITANVEYDVWVAAISSQLGAFTEAFQFQLQGEFCITLCMRPTPTSTCVIYLYDIDLSG